MTTNNDSDVKTQNSTYLETTVICRCSMMSGAEVREPVVCTSQMQASLLHHLLFGPTLSGRGEEEEGGGDGGAKDDLSPGDCHRVSSDSPFSPPLLVFDVHWASTKIQELNWH